MLCFHDNLPNFTLLLWVLSPEMSHCISKFDCRWLGSHFDSLKRSCSVAWSVPFLWRPIFYVCWPFYNFRSPKGDCEKSWAWSTVRVVFFWMVRKGLLHVHGLITRFLRWLNTVLWVVSGSVCFKIRQTTWWQKKQWYLEDDFSESTH